MRPLAASLALVALVALSPAASAQEHVLRTLRVGAWDVADLGWVRTAPGEPVRVLVHGTLTSAIDGAEIDALEVRTGAEVHEDLVPVVFPDGSRVVERRGPHAFVVEVPAGAGATVALNVPALAGRALVTATDERESLRGAILVDVLAPAAAAASAQPAPAELDASMALPFAIAAPGLLGLPLLFFGLVVLRARRDPADLLLARARRARAAIAGEARVLGPAFDGALAATDALRDAAVKERAHLAEVEDALRRTAWVGTDDARASRAALLTRRAASLARLGTLVARLEEGVVRLAACVADRSAIADVERDLERARAELELGEQVEREVAALA